MYDDYNWIPLVVLSKFYLVRPQSPHTHLDPSLINILKKREKLTYRHTFTRQKFFCVCFVSEKLARANVWRNRKIVLWIIFNRNFILLDKETLFCCCLCFTLAIYLIKLIKYQMVHFTIVYLNSFMSTFHYSLTCIVALRKCT